MLADHRDRAQRRSQRKGAHVTHEHRRRIGVEPQKSQTRPQDGCSEHRKFARAFDVLNEKIVLHESMSGNIGHDRIGQRRDHDWSHR